MLYITENFSIPMKVILINKNFKTMETTIKWITYAFMFTFGFPYHFTKGFIRGWRGY